MKLRSGTKSLIYLTACALHSEKALLSKIPEKDKDKLLSLAHRHSLGAITAIALEGADGFKESFSEAPVRKWSSVRAAAVKRRVLFDMERDRLLGILEKKGIWYCPLKGIILQELYPMYEMREMSDNDILFDSSKRETLKGLMLKEGYTIEDHGVTNHDLYTKEPVYNFEFHTRLFMHTFSTVFTSYYDEIFKKLIKDQDKTYAYHMSDEDFYIYMTAHAYKHYDEGGTGLRSLTDAYIYNQKKGAALDREYIKRECQRLGIYGFERLCRRVSFKLFSDPKTVFANVAALSQKEKEFLSYISFTGSYCTKEDFIKSRMKKKGSKMTYVFSRLFPDENYYREAHPFLYKNKALIPAFLVYRAAKMLATNRNAVLKEIAILRRG